ncbi:hypothetical protein [Marinitoga sp. 38H-ov]|uniref:hypothetical protein n=1 Tax=Marinitoga sp. 38H-ov TaxID=1755814 RepID=UPI0013EAA969|nr:hypothetical protein [Marinitoga sp. 38H-ov]
MKKWKMTLKKIRIIDRLKENYPITLLCKIAGISRNSYYRYKRGIKRDTELRD